MALQKLGCVRISQQTLLTEITVFFDLPVEAELPCIKSSFSLLEHEAVLCLAVLVGVKVMGIPGFVLIDYEMPRQPSPAERA